MTDAIAQRDEADITIRNMIQQLIEVMHVPIKIIEDKVTKDVAIQTGYSCTTCDVGYSDKNGLRRHIKAVHEKYSYNCRICTASYTRLGTLLNHLKKVHSTTQKNK